MPSYAAAVEENRLASERGIAVTPDDQLHRDVIQRIMCDLETDLRLWRMRMRLNVALCSGGRAAPLSGRRAGKLRWAPSAGDCGRASVRVQRGSAVRRLFGSQRDETLPCARGLMPDGEHA